MRKHIPNLLTLLNLSGGSVALVFALEGQWQWAVYLVLAAAVLDFLDGLAARLLGAYSDTGKQLDSLADLVSFGLVPAVFLYAMFRSYLGGDAYSVPSSLALPMQLSVLLVPVCSAIRLARFNTGAGSTTFFSGLPTPAHGLFWTGIYWQFMDQGALFGTALHPYFLWAIMLVMAFHMILPVPMYTLKFEHFRLRGNLMRYLLLGLSAFLLAFVGIAGLPLAVLSYILLSLLNFMLQMRVSS